MFNNGNGGYSLSDIAAVTRGGMGGNYNFGGGSGGFGYGGDGAWWLIVLFLFAFAGFGNNGWGGFGGNGGGGNLGGAFPWLLTAENNTDNLVTTGFNQAAIQSTLSGIQSGITSGFGDTALGIAGVNQNICQTGNGITSAISNGFASAEIADNARQMANMQQAFASQTATTAAINGLQSSLDSCCCENRLASADLKYTIATENCADRAAINDGVRDIVAAQNAGTQAILDKLCQQEIDALKAQNANLQTQVTMQNLAASQAAQTAQLIADNTA